MSDYKVLPVLINDNNILYRIMNVSIGNDQSFYFTFPNKEEYKLASFTRNIYSDKEYDQKTISLNPVDFDYKLPKISFHPKNYTMHIKSQETDVKFLEEFELYNFNSFGYFECPIMQIVLPYDMSFFEVYNKTKYPVTCAIDKTSIDKSLAIYILVHSSELIPPQILPIHGHSQYKLQGTLDTNNAYTLSFYKTYIPKNTSSSLTVTLNTKKELVMILLTKY